VVDKIEAKIALRVSRKCIVITFIDFGSVVFKVSANFSGIHTGCEGVLQLMNIVLITELMYACIVGGGVLRKLRIYIKRK